MSPSRGINQHNIVQHLPFSCITREGNSIARHSRSILAIALFEELDGADVLAPAEFGEVADVDAELFDGAGAEGIGCYD